MPGMDGIEVLRKIKEESPDTEVIMITGHGDMDLAIQSLKFDATDFITKPIHDEVLGIALRRAEEKIALKDQIRQYTENLERLVAEKTAKLLEAERLAAVGQTVAGLAHAIKNIAGALTGGAFVLEKGIELDNRTYLRQGWEMVKGNVAKIKQLALDLLNYSREREAECTPCDPNLPVREVFDLTLPHARECGVQMEMDLGPDLPQAWIDPEGVHRCLLNLVNNAIDACTQAGCPRPGGRVILRSRGCEGGGIRYEVIDEGCGMDEETRSKIFQRFFSTKGSRGTGLGLMVTKKIVDEHGGKIECESEKGRGTRFTICLPGGPRPPGGVDNATETQDTKRRAP
jgi:signal transduction histidine kinase